MMHNCVMNFQSYKIEKKNQSNKTPKPKTLFANKPNNDKIQRFQR